MATSNFDWSEYLALARELANRSDEASLRSALSRIYYFVYHLAMDRANSNGFALFPGEAAHKQLWRNFIESPDPECRSLGLIAGRLKEKRERADYNIIYPRLADEMMVTISEAEKFADRLSKLPLRLPRPIQSGSR